MTDALEVANKHQGDLKVESRPARGKRNDSENKGSDDEDLYTQPFVTTVTIPLADVLRQAAEHFTVKSRFRTVEYLGRIRAEYAGSTG